MSENEKRDLIDKIVEISKEKIIKIGYISENEISDMANGKYSIIRTVYWILSQYFDINSVIRG